MDESGGGSGWDKNNRETIHSGQFMVSHFEDGDDEVDDDEMPDPDRPDSSAPPQTSKYCTDVQLYVPKTEDDEPKTLIGVFNQHELSIETSLSKLFKCMKLAYRHKLSSPKWNRFKGIRLRWKDKIRLNNLIWRCWHMQFILRKKTSCQFASPLDCDIHNKPEAVLLEGKYWKRDYNVISAEYKKWRRFYRDRSLENQNALDTISEQDFDLNFYGDKVLMNLDENLWPTDVLLSAINQPFSFPDTREIARFGGIADFIQPSLGPLQPNLDFMDTFDSFADFRLPSVPEEGADDILKTLNLYIDDPQHQQPQQSQPSAAPAAQPSSSAHSSSSLGATSNMNSSVKFGEMQERNVNLGLSGVKVESTGGNRPSPADQIPNLMMEISEAGLGMQQDQIQYTAKMYTQDMQELNMKQRRLPNQPVRYQFLRLPEEQQQAAMGNVEIEQNKKSKEPEMFSQNNNTRTQLLKHLNKREPHNYDKAMPTIHQTTIYNQILNQQQQQQSQQMVNSYNSQSNVLNLSQQQQHQQFGNKGILMQSDLNPFNPTANLATGMDCQVTGDANQQMQQPAFKSMSIGFPIQKYNQVVQNPQQQQSMSNILMTGIQNPNEGGNTAMQQQQQHQPLNKEMFRSNSLPINASFQFQNQLIQQTTNQNLNLKHDNNNFALPKYQPKQTHHQSKFRGRSNSMVMKQQHQQGSLPSPATLFAATSEPALMQLLQQSSGLQLPHSSPATSGSTSTLNSVINISPKFSFQAKPPSESQNVTKSSSSSSVLSFNAGNSPGPSSASEQFFQMTNTSSRQSSPVHKGSKDLDLDVLSPSSDGQQRRVGHIYAEQKRRYNIKNGFDILQSMIPQLQHSASAKLSKAAILQKGAEYVKQLRAERTAVNEKMEDLKKERDILNNQISHLHSVLPANGAPVSRQRTNRLVEMYQQYVQSQTVKNWKFWIFGLIFEPLLLSFNSTVSISSLEELHRTAMLWVDQSTLVELRPAVTNKLRYLSTTTDILSENPSTIQEEVMKAIAKSVGPRNGLIPMGGNNNSQTSTSATVTPSLSPISGGVISDASLPNSPMGGGGSTAVIPRQFHH